MKRRLLIIAIFLLLGAVMNVAVAWGCAVWVDVGAVPPVRGLSSSEPPRFNFSLRARLGASRFAHRVHEEWIVFVDGYRLEPRPEVVPSWMLNPPGAGKTHTIEDVRGLPALAMHCTVRKSYVGRSVPGGGIRLARKPFVMLVEGCRMLPLRPIWPGFAVNTIFYAAILWPLILGPFALRRFLRLRRGLCPKCAYPMGESAVCSECGVELPSRPAAT